MQPYATLATRNPSCVHVFSNFSCRFQFWSKFISVLRFSIISFTVLRFSTCSNFPLLYFFDANLNSQKTQTWLLKLKAQTSFFFYGWKLNCITQTHNLNFTKRKQCRIEFHTKQTRFLRVSVPNFVPWHSAFRVSANVLILVSGILAAELGFRKRLISSLAVDIHVIKVISFCNPISLLKLYHNDQFKIHAVVHALGSVVEMYTTCYAAPSLKNLDPVSELEQLTLASNVLIISISSPF